MISNCSKRLNCRKCNEDFIEVVKTLPTLKKLRVQQRAKLFKDLFAGTHVKSSHVTLAQFVEGC